MNLKEYFAWFMGFIYVLAGLNHFINPAFYERMLVGFIPYGKGIVIVSGIAEILCGTGLIIPATRSMAAWGTIALLVCIFPANIYMALNYAKWNISAGWLYARLPLQFVLIWLAWSYTRK